MRPSVAILLSTTLLTCATPLAAAPPPADGAVVKARLAAAADTPNLLPSDAWRNYERGFQRQGDVFTCVNAAAGDRRGAVQTVTLNQAQPAPIVATAESRAAGVEGAADANYALYLDLKFQDGTSLWGQAAPFASGTHDWQRRQVLIVPEKPVKTLSCYLLFRGRTGQVWFRDPQLQVIQAPAGAALFDGVPVMFRGAAAAGFQVRDVAADSDFVRIERQALGLKLEATSKSENGATFVDVTLRDTTGRDRAVTLVYSLPVAAQNLQWLADPRHSEPATTGERMSASRFHAGANGRLSRYPLAAVADAQHGQALGIDMSRPAFYRLGYNAAAGELFLAYDLGLTPEKPTATLRLCHYAFAPAWGFRAALDTYYRLFPEHFRCRTPRQGLWMPFAKISKVEGWEDFGFRFKEGNDETAWDDAHDILTFRYTEPMTWWMPLAKDQPRTHAAALAEAQRLAEVKKDPRALAFITSGYRDEQGQPPARLLDTPWCNGAVWSMNSMPGLAGDPTHFKVQWNPQLREKLYGPQRRGDLDGEYIDSSEGYVTDELDFRRDHFAAAQTPLCFAPDSHRPAIFRGLITFEYVRAIAADVHDMGKLMMANGAPTRLCWLLPLLEVAGTETNWNRQGKWQPMSDADLLYRRALCRGKPYCFLMNTEFEQFTPELVERYMQRSLAYGMFPGFFSHNASQGHYFTRPELYNRDRPLFKKYVPLCKLVAEAGWEPVTLARSSDEQVYVERFGRRYLTVFNDSDRPREATITLDADAASVFGPPTKARLLMAGTPMTWQNGQIRLALAAESVAVLEIGDQP